MPWWLLQVSYLYIFRAIIYIQRIARPLKIVCLLGHEVSIGLLILFRKPTKNDKVQISWDFKN